MKILNKTLAAIFILSAIVLRAQTDRFIYELEVSPNDSDVFHIAGTVPKLSESDNVYSFVSFAPGVHQPLDFGRFVRSFKVYDDDGNELLTQKLSTNDWRILDPQKVKRIEYEIDDSFDMDVKKHPIYPMSGTGINENYAVINTHGVFGYFQNLKSNPIKLKIGYREGWKIGTALTVDGDGYYIAESYYQLADSPILLGELSSASLRIGEIDVDAFVYSPIEEIEASRVLQIAKPVLESAYDFVEFSPVNKYSFLMFFISDKEAELMPALASARGALEHSYSSTYALSADPRTLGWLKDDIAHEFMHILTPLNLRSEIIANFDYSKPTSEDQHLWLYEGVTTWVGMIMQLRSGNISIEDYLNWISEKIEISEYYGTDYSLARLSAEWWTDEGNKNYGNIYQLGALTANSLDIKLLQLSNGERGLREVYLELIKRYGKDKPFNNELFFDELVDMTYPEIRDFIDRHIKNYTPFDFEKDFAAIGIKYYPSRKSKNPVPLFGLYFGSADGKNVIDGFSENHKHFGLEVGDVVEEIFGEVLTEENEDVVFARKEKMKAGDSYDIVVSRNGERISLNGELVERKDYHVFEIDNEASEEARELRVKWSGYLKN